MKSCFISCMYWGLDGTEFMGRPSRGCHYQYSTRSLLRMNHPIYMFTGHEYMDSIKNEIIDSGFDPNNNLILIEEELKDLPMYNIVKPIKEKHEFGSDHNRCFEIMYSKTYWLKKIIEEHPDYENYYWIDAGLSHCGIFPHKCLHVQPPISYYDMYYNYDVFTEKYVESLDKLSENGKIYAMLFDQTERVWGGYPDHKYYKEEVQPIHMIGGLFGGKKESVLKFIDLFDQKLNETLNDDVLYAEENVFTIIVNDNPELFNSEIFNTWYYPGSDLYESWCSGMSYTRCFYELFTEKAYDE